MCRYMRLPIAFRDNQQISLADLTTSRLFFFKAEVLQKQDSEATISVLKLNTHNLWHQRLGHTNSQVIKALPAHVIGGPATGVASPPMGLCNGCEKGKSRQLPFPPSKSQAETTLALVHSDLDKMSTASIDGYKWTATYLNDHTQYGMMFFLKHKDEQFDTFKTYKAWAERQTGWKLKTICTDRVLIKGAKMLPTRTWNRTSDFNAILSTTK